MALVKKSEWINKHDKTGKKKNQQQKSKKKQEKKLMPR